MMKKSNNRLLILAVLLSMLILYSLAIANRKNEITIAVPAELMAKIINDALPIEIAKKKEISGAIWIQSIDKLKLGNDKISFFMKMHGEDVEYTGKIGKTPVVLSFGTIDLAFNCDTSLRYDSEENILYVKPEIITEETEQETLALLLAALVSGQEFPLEIQKLKPIIAKLGNAALTINMNISNIYTLNDVLIIGIKPTVTKSPGSKTELS